MRIRWFVVDTSSYIAAVDGEVNVQERDCFFRDVMGEVERRVEVIEVTDNFFELIKRTGRDANVVVNIPL